MTTNTDAVPEGWKLLPVEPTDEMVRAGFNKLIGDRDVPDTARACYDAMLAASPAAPDHIGDAAEKVAAPTQSGNSTPVEAWHGDRKVTIYDDCVLRAWGTNIESEMSDVPRTLQTVQDALDWLYAATRPASGGE